MRTLIEILRDNASLDDRAVTFVRASGEESRVSFPNLQRFACRRAHALRALGLRKGDRVAIVLQDPEEFVLTFLGALTAGVVAVPIYPPATLAKLEAYGETVRHVLAASGASILITSDSLRPMLEEHLLGAAGGAEHFSTRLVLERDVRGDEAAEAAPDVQIALDDLAFLQFTSGSTSRPKGVRVTHRNLSVNSHAIMFDGLKCTPEDRGVCWLPLYHDMGLIGFVIAPLYAKVQVMFLPTASFIRRPSLWLDAIHRFRATISFAPNFAYALATRAVQERQTTNWDLSCVRVLGCGAEPIQADVLRAFVKRFAAQGLKETTPLPCYGMAEATLAITFSELDRPLRTERIDVESMRRGRAAPANGGASMELVSCGKAFPGHELGVFSTEGSALGEREVGEVWLKGASVTDGYFDDDAATAQTFGGGWLKTGDLGFLSGDELYICGRAKDLIILNGKNYYPDDIERVVSRCEGVRDGQCVAFSRLDASGAEIAVVVAESRKGASESEAISASIVQSVRAETGVTLGEVHLIRRTSLPKTSSGKVRRRETKLRLERGALEIVTGDRDSSQSIPPPPDAAPRGQSVDIHASEEGCATPPFAKRTNEVANGIE